MKKKQLCKYGLIAPAVLVGLGLVGSDHAFATETNSSEQAYSTEVVLTNEDSEIDSAENQVTNTELVTEMEEVHLPVEAPELQEPNQPTTEETSPAENIVNESTEEGILATDDETGSPTENEETTSVENDSENRDEDAAIVANEESTEITSDKVADVSDAIQRTSNTTEIQTTAAGNSSPVYRIYNPGNGEHFYTTNLSEKDWLVKIGWGIYEGIAFKSPSVGKSVYRLYNQGLRDHHYTMSWDEVTWLTKNYGWTFEGESWKSTDSNNGKKVYRLFHPYMTTGSHHYTMNWDEVTWLTNSHGWKYEGVGFYSSGDSEGALSYVLLNSPYINQNSSGYPMGCEAAALLQALKTKGYAQNYDLKSFIKEMPVANDNNPNNGFAGRPDTVQSGVYQSIFAKPLANWGSKYGKVSDITGSSCDYLKEELRKGNPIVVYVTLNFANPQYGRYFWGTGIDNAHIMTLDGFNSDNNTYHVSDPNGGKYWVSASKFEASYNLRKSAVVVR
ncbi:C39 family peptidase [Enterococcus sp. AZ109]|uniref:C39 family peptidase n=1 Tax=Enterococcus sp. AZ109 TaxID=2774634 RepID=UPI003F27354F